MSDFSLTWELSRQRFVDAISDLNDAQLNWHLHDKALSIAQMAVHVAGVEVSFASQLLRRELDDESSRLKASATDGVVNEKPFPFTASELTAPRVASLLSIGRDMAAEIITEPSEEILSGKVVSALGPTIDGKGALTRLAFHPGYHLGQAYLIRTAPGFPD